MFTNAVKKLFLKNKDTEGYVLSKENKLIGKVIS